MLDFTARYEALQRRDPALDGVVFVAVKTTGVYCRPVCPARTPLARNVRFFPSAAAAERAGYRPCLRCRPETAPFCPAWKGTRTTVERALACIDAGDLDRDSVDTLAARLGVGSRHLSRLFAQHLHASPLQVALSRRLQRAKCLLDDTDLPIALVAERAGFSSARRMNAAFARLYGRPAAAFRKRRRTRPVQDLLFGKPDSTFPGYAPKRASRAHGTRDMPHCCEPMPRGFGSAAGRRS
jgi:AraC family transcriptional regulator of adaptative response / DNA-3-methyladenine glycosylase II